MFLQNFDVAKYLSCRDLKDIFSMQKTEVQLTRSRLKTDANLLKSRRNNKFRRKYYLFPQVEFLCLLVTSYALL